MCELIWIENLVYINSNLCVKIVSSDLFVSELDFSTKYLKHHFPQCTKWYHLPPNIYTSMTLL